MKKKISRFFGVVIFLLLTVSFIPAAFAAEDTSPPTALSFSPETGTVVGTDGFTVTVYGVGDPSGVKTVTFAVYNMDGGLLNQVEYNAASIGNGAWSRTIDLSNFGNEPGTYMINILGRDSNDNKGLMGSIKVELPAPASEKIKAFINAAAAQLGKPYVLGGKGPDVFDCSGLVYYALNSSGYQIDYMTSAEWAASSYTVIGAASLQRGDILCFKGHVGIYLGNGSMIEANGTVRIREDILNSDYFANNFICAHRLFE
jgi:cell wall-associated NlpC family hydrolase